MLWVRERAWHRIVSHTAGRRISLASLSDINRFLRHRAARSPAVRHIRHRALLDPLIWSIFTIHETAVLRPSTANDNVTLHSQCPGTSIVSLDMQRRDTTRLIVFHRAVQRRSRHTNNRLTLRRSARYNNRVRTLGIAQAGHRRPPRSSVVDCFW